MLMRLLRKKNLFLSIILAFGLFGFGAVSCTTMDNVGGGTIIGAALGAGVGALVGDPGIGAAIGAGVGAMGGLAKDSMEKGQQNRVHQSQTNTEIQQLKMDAEIDRQVASLKERGYKKEEYTYKVTTTASGVIVVEPKKREVYAKTEILR